MTTLLNEHIKVLLTWVDTQKQQVSGADIPQYVHAAHKSLSKLVDHTPAQDAEVKNQVKVLPNE